MKQYCKVCDQKQRISKTRDTKFGILINLECKHQTIMSNELWVEKERKFKLRMAQFKKWVAQQEIEELGG
jgi:hypothetical protein